MKKINGTVFLAFFALILVFLAIAVVWISKELGVQLAVGLGIGVFIVIVLFAQQILTGIQVNDNTQNLVDYDRQQVGLEEQRAKIQVEYAKAFRENSKVQGRIDERQYEAMRVAAHKMAGLLTEAEVAKVKAEMQGMGMLTDNSQTIDLE